MPSCLAMPEDWVSPFGEYGLLPPVMLSLTMVEQSEPVRGNSFHDNLIKELHGK